MWCHSRGGRLRHLAAEKRRARRTLLQLCRMRPERKQLAAIVRRILQRLGLIFTRSVYPSGDSTMWSISSMPDDEQRAGREIKVPRFAGDRDGRNPSRFLACRANNIQADPKVPPS
jgi:hypothetical protein